jgi:2-desacetyl-2-hydroxyethyl bacteriochlorophyllide A dehydrogenase
MKALVLKEPHCLEITEKERPGDRDKAVIQIKAIGICGTEISSFNGSFPMGAYPRTLGHEIAGEIIEIGENDKNLKAGDRVSLEPYRYCGSCYPCSIGRTNCCENMRCIGVHEDGAASEYFAHEPTLLHKIPDGMKWEHAVFADPLTNAMQGIYRASVKAGEKVVITGAGPIGILAAQHVNSIGAEAILISSMRKRMAAAASLGIKYIIDRNKKDPVKAIQEITGGRMAEAVIECSGAPSAIRSTLNYASYAGRIALIGYSREEIPLPTHVITRKELDVLGSRNCLGHHPAALEAIRAGQVKVEPLISSLINFGELPKYYEKISGNPDDYIKVVALL